MRKERGQRTHSHVSVPPPLQRCRLNEVHGLMGSRKLWICLESSGAWCLVCFGPAFPFANNMGPSSKESTTATHQWAARSSLQGQKLDGIGSQKSKPFKKRIFFFVSFKYSLSSTLSIYFRICNRYMLIYNYLDLTLELTP